MFGRFTANEERGIMRGPFKRSTIETELAAGRPRAPEHLVDGIVGRITPQDPVRSTRARLGVAGALTTAMLVVAGATGGFAGAAQALHMGSAHPLIGADQPSCSQYGKAPVITRVSPSKGRVGKRVSIKGLNFLGMKARHHKMVSFPVTSVTLNGTAASFEIRSNKKIKATVPEGATSGSWVVTNCAGSATSQTFTVK